MGETRGRPASGRARRGGTRGRAWEEQITLPRAIRSQQVVRA